MDVGNEIRARAGRHRVSQHGCGMRGQAQKSRGQEETAKAVAAICEVFDLKTFLSAYMSHEQVRLRPHAFR